MPFTIRSARRADGPALVGLVRGLAEFERLPPPVPVGDHEFRRLELAAQIRDRICQVTHAHGLHAGERRLGARVVRTHEPLERGPASAFCNREHAADAADATVERELAA